MESRIGNRVARGACGENGAEAGTGGDGKGAEDLQNRAETCACCQCTVSSRQGRPSNGTVRGVPKSAKGRGGERGGRPGDKSPTIHGWGIVCVLAARTCDGCERQSHLVSRGDEERKKEGVSRVCVLFVGSEKRCPTSASQKKKG
jgi:hypothetical protein